MQRRQLSRAEVDRVLEYWLKRHTKRSNPWIAQDLGIGKNRVEEKRRELESSKSIELAEKTEGRDGKSYPRRSAPRSPKPGLPDTSPLTFPAPDLQRRERVFSARFPIF